MSEGSKDNSESKPSQPKPWYILDKKPTGLPPEKSDPGVIPNQDVQAPNTQLIESEEAHLYQLERQQQLLVGQEEIREAVQDQTDVLSGNQQRDSDGDGIPDNVDTDVDGDGNPD